MISSKIENEPPALGRRRARATGPRARAIALLIAACSALHGSDARADAGAMAEALFQQGRKLLEQGHVAEACEKLESSYRIDAALGTLVNLAGCHEKQGRLATAWGEYNEAITAAKRAGQAGREQLARARVVALTPRLSHLIVNVSAPARVDGLALTIDGVPLAPGAWGTPIPVDAGAHTIVAAAPRRISQTTPTRVDEAQSVVLTLPLLDLAPVPPPIVAPSSWKTPVGVAGLGLGAVGLGLGTYFGARALDLASTSAKGCKPDGGCDQAAYAAYVDGRSSATLANAFLVGGGVLVAAGGTLLILRAVEKQEPQKTAPVAAIRVIPTAGPGVGLLTIAGAW